MSGSAEVENEMPCDHCGCNPATRRRQNTAYVDDELNWAVLCSLCQVEVDEYWKEQWDEYYANCM